MIIIYYLNEHKICIMIIILLSFGLVYLLLNPKIVKETEIVYQEINELDEKNNKIKVDIKGAVTNPGVYEISDDSRIIDVINLAGGLREDANIDYLNLSEILKDQMVIKIFTNEEIEKNKKVEIVYEYIPLECECIKEQICEEENKKININKASKEELMNLNGFGESKALSVIEYRLKNGDFTKIEDIMNVNGIGENVFNKIKENITV